MSQAPHSHDEGPIQTPQQLTLAIVLAFVVPVFIIALLVTYVTTTAKSSAGSSAQSPEAVALRISPVGSVQIQTVTVAPGSRTGEEVFKAQCTTCHTAGALGAPKFGDAAAWGPRIATGLDALLNSALKGKNNMTAQGGGAFTDIEVKRAVVYMANAGGAKFEAPPVAAAGASAPADAAPAAAASAPAPAASTAAPAAAPAPAPAAKTADAGAGAAPALYTSTCFACHGAGVLNAPKLGDKAAWAPRLALGVDGLTASAIKGKNLMPPKGGSSASEAEIKAVVAYMVSQAK
jgi:cytochrome c5